MRSANELERMCSTSGQRKTERRDLSRRLFYINLAIWLALRERRPVLLVGWSFAQNTLRLHVLFGERATCHASTAGSQLCRHWSRRWCERRRNWVCKYMRNLTRINFQRPELVSGNHSMSRRWIMIRGMRLKLLRDLVWQTFACLTNAIINADPMRCVMHLLNEFLWIHWVWLMTSFLCPVIHTINANFFNRTEWYWIKQVLKRFSY